MTLEVSLQLKRQNFCLDVSFSLASHGVLALFGQSGAGKSTLLRCIAGLEQHAIGQLVVNQEVWQDKDQFIPTHLRSIGFVFQQPNLFPHLSIFKNLQYGVRRLGKAYMHYLDEYIDIFDLNHLLAKKPNKLSVGEQQRVALARAMLLQPHVLLLDEPLSALDMFHKQEILPYFLKAQRLSKLTMVYVSHDVDELLLLANHLVVLDAGSVLHEGKFQEALLKIWLSTNKYPGLDNALCTCIDGVITNILYVDGLAKMSFLGGELWVDSCNLEHQQLLSVRIRASDMIVSLMPPKDSSAKNILTGRLIELLTSEYSKDMILRVMVGSTIVYVSLSAISSHDLKLEPNMMIWLQILRVVVCG